MPLPRVLVVEDFRRFREFVVSTLEKRAEFQILEASDGLEAVQKAETLQPDLILLDIGLPKLNGIEVAKRVRQVAPAAKIVFVSQEPAPEVTQEAFRLGALGYVQKARAHSDLLPAVEAALKDTQFINAGMRFDEQLLRETTTKLTRLTNLSDLLNGILDAAIKITAADFGNVQIYDQKTGELKLAAHRGFGPEFVKFFETVRDGNCCCGAALKSGKRMIVEDVATDLIFDAETRAMLLKAEARAVQSTPIYSRNAVLRGMLNTHYRRPSVRMTTI